MGTLSPPVILHITGQDSSIQNTGQAPFPALRESVTRMEQQPALGRLTF